MHIKHGATLPDQPITVIHRADGSGTTFAWTDFLSKTSPDWKSAVGSGLKVVWPTGTAAPGNEGVAAAIANTPGALGYVELTYAVRHRLNFGLVRNAASRYVQANLESLNAAAAASRIRRHRLPPLACQPSRQGCLPHHHLPLDPPAPGRQPPKNRRPPPARPLDAHRRPERMLRPQRPPPRRLRPSANCPLSPPPPPPTNFRAVYPVPHARRSAHLLRRQQKRAAARRDGSRPPGLLRRRPGRTHPPLQLRRQ